MRHTLKALQVGCVLIVCCFAASASADDLFPPPWRGADGSTVQEWDFVDMGVYDAGTGSYDYAPDGVDVPLFNPYGDAIAHVWPGIGQDYWDVWGDRDGVWPLSGTIQIDIPNSDVPNPYKEIWIQLTWAQQVETSEPFPGILVDSGYTVSDPEVMNDILLGPTGTGTGDGQWHHTTWRFFIWDNPPFETITIDGTVMVDQIVIDTICTVPEPATLAIVGLSGLVVLLRRRR